MKRIIFGVGGMSCQHCAGSVEKALKGVGGVLNVNVELANSRVILDTDEALFDIHEAEKAITYQGYDYLGLIG